MDATMDGSAGAPDSAQSPPPPGRSVRPSRSSALSYLGPLGAFAAVIALSAGALPEGLAPFPFDDQRSFDEWDRDGRDRSDELDPSELVAMAQASTLRVAARACGMTVTGSGFVLGDVLVTNRHLVEAVDEAKVDQPVGPMSVAVLRRAAGPDLATLAPVAAMPLESAPADAVAGDEVVYAGHADGGETVVRRATVHLQADGSAYGMTGTVMLLDGESTAGFSGGPVLDLHGRLVGVLQGYEPNLRLTLAVPVSALDAWLQDPSQDAAIASAGLMAGDSGTMGAAGMGAAGMGAAEECR